MATTTFQIQGIKGGKDERGMDTITASFFIAGTTAEQALNLALPNPGTNLPLFSRSIGDWGADNQSFTVVAVYKGLSTGEPGAEQDLYVLSPEWREEPIEAFPARASLIAKYGGYFDGEGRLKFPQTLGAADKQGFQKTTTGPADNPMFGVTTFPVLRVVASHTYVRRTVPATVYSRIGNVIDQLPSGFKFNNGKKWLVDPPQVQNTGNAWSIKEIYKDITNLPHIDVLQSLLRYAK